MNISGFENRVFSFSLFHAVIKDRRRRPEGDEWEPIKILLENLAYIPKSTKTPLF
jgi:hypothetical protein